MEGTAMPLANPAMTSSSLELAEGGYRLVKRFCRVNEISVPRLEIVPKNLRWVNACAYYRDGVIRICLEECSRPCGGAPSRNWSWPGSTIDRTPYGVVCHEAGHHTDLESSHLIKRRYSGDYGESVMRASKEKPISGYCPDPAEWFAEMFRVFLANPNLLRRVRPETHRLLLTRWKPVMDHISWERCLNVGAPERVLASQRNKFARGICR